MPAKKEDLRRYIIMSKEGFLTDQLGAPRFQAERHDGCR